jgi:hypothetical protein
MRGSSRLPRAIAQQLIGVPIRHVRYSGQAVRIWTRLDTRLVFVWSLYNGWQRV